MTIPFEEELALQNTRDFLRSLLLPRETPNVPGTVRLRAQQLLRHYPYSYRVCELFKDKIQEYEDAVSKVEEVQVPADEGRISTDGGTGGDDRDPVHPAGPGREADS